MIQLETWFKDFFLSPYFPRWGNKDEIEVKRICLWITRLLSISWYLSVASIFIWILGLSSIHLAQHMNKTTIIDKIFFFASPTVWDKYFLTNGGGFFDSFRRSTGIGERVFICAGISIVVISLATLLLSLLNISISSKEGIKELKYISYSLCFPVFGGIASFFILFHFLMVQRHKQICDYFQKTPLISNFLNFYLKNFIKDENSLKNNNFVNVSYLKNPSKKLKNLKNLIT